MNIVSVPFCYACGVPHVPDDIAERVRAGESISIDIVYQGSGVAANVLRYGTGALDIDGCRVGAETIQSSGWTGMDARRFEHGTRPRDYSEGKEPQPSSHVGRWPPNVALDETAAAALDAMSGERSRSEPNPVRAHGPGIGYGGYGPTNTVSYPDRGGASRFFYVARSDPADADLPIDEQIICEIHRTIGKAGDVCLGCKSGAPPPLPIDDPDTLRFGYFPKAGREERNRGLEGMPERIASVGNHEAAGRDGANPKNYIGGKQDRVLRGEPASKPRANHHPTVKSVSLMRWLVRLVTPPGGTCLDPFAGSGSTGIACVYEERDFIGIEQDPEYARISELRINHAIGPLFVGEGVA